MRKSKIESEVEVTEELKTTLYELMSKFPHFRDMAGINYYVTLFLNEQKLKVQLYYGHEYFYKIKITKNSSSDTDIRTEVIYKPNSKDID